MSDHADTIREALDEIGRQHDLRCSCQNENVADCDAIMLMGDAHDALRRLSQGDREATGIIDLLRDEISRQDKIHPDGFPATRDGVRLGLASAEDELRESLEAWTTAKREPVSSIGWYAVQVEILQAAAVLMRTFRELLDARGFVYPFTESRPAHPWDTSEPEQEATDGP